MRPTRLAASLLLTGSLLLPWFPARAQSVALTQVAQIVEPTGIVTTSPQSDAGSLTPTEQATVAQVEAAMGLGSDYQVMPGPLAPGGKGALSLQWPSISGPQAFAELDPATGDLLDLSYQISYSNNPASSTGPRRSWASDQTAAAHYAQQLGGTRWAECVAVPVAESASYENPDANSYLFPRQENGLGVNGTWGLEGLEGLEVDLDSHTGSFRGFRANWTPGLSFPSPKPQLTKDQALADWEQNAPPELAASNGETYYQLPPPVLASSGKPLAGGGMGFNLPTATVSLGLVTGAALPTPVPPVGAPAATAYLNQLGLLPAGSQLEKSTNPYMGQVITVPAPGNGPTGPTFNAVGSVTAVGAEVYSVTYTVSFDANGRLSQFSPGYQMSGPGFGEGGSGFLPGAAGQTSLPPSELLKRATAFLNAWGVPDPTAWTWGTASFPPGLGVATPFELMGFFHQNGVIDLDGGIQLSLDSATGQVAAFTYRPAPAASPGGPFLDPAAIQKRLLSYFPWELRYQVSGAQVSLVYGLGDSRGAIGLRATDGVPVDGAGHDLSIEFNSVPSDVPAWAAAGVTYALSNFDLATEPDGKFHSAKLVTADEVLSALMPLKQMGRLQPAFFPGAGYPGEPSIMEQAKNDGLLSSLPKPDDQVNRGDLAVWVARALGFDRLLGMSTVLPTPFTDVGALPTEQQNAIALLYDLGYFQGYPGGKFNPAAVVTRAEWAVLLDRLSGN